MKTLDSAQFLKDVAAHEMKILRDDGLYRHLEFHQKENSWNQWFEIVTWPGKLVVNGDMGSWTFARVEDMFSFFRHARGEEFYINPSYWSEKILAESRFGGPSRKFDVDTFKSSVLSRLDDCDLDVTDKAAIKEALDEEVFTGDEDESWIRRQLADFEYGDDKFSFSDTWEISGEAYTYHYLWCLYAIVWAIQSYDRKAAVEKATA